MITEQLPATMEYLVMAVGMHIDSEGKYNLVLCCNQTAAVVKLDGVYGFKLATALGMPLSVEAVNGDDAATG